MRILSISRTLLFAAAIITLSIGCDHHHDDDGLIVETIYIDQAPIPAGVYTVTGDGEVQVYWSPIRDAGVLGYGVYRSNSYDGAYHQIAEVTGDESDSYLDRGLENGVTYFYAVDSYNHDESSDLSYEEAADTPRPAGRGVTLFHRDHDPDRSALDFTVVQDDISDEIVLPWYDDWAAYYLMELDDLLRLVPTAIEHQGETFYNDIQDFGYTDHMDDISFAPVKGWSLDPVGVEMIEGHTYIIWTWDDHFAKIRVVALSESHVVLDWAYQISDDEIERYQLKNSKMAERKWNRSATNG